ncbi:MAG: class I SAM-dependent methyltransferase [Thermodesulfobacteriota bacterium]|nr:class I SAM-dependent methyltransferase [Thermodesulfobacteriota bacterium]
MHYSISDRAEDEIAHSKMLAQRDPEFIWGWGKPAGRLRAKRRAKLIIRGAQLGPDVRALEIGCGSGMFTEMFAESGAWLLAVDISSDLLKRAQSRNIPNDKVQFLNKSFEDCDFDGKFDAVIGSSVLHHLDIARVLPKIYSVLKPGGIMSFAEPNMLNPQVFIERKFSAFIPCLWYVSGYETALIRWKFRNLLLEAGFEDVKITPFDWLHPSTPFPLIQLISVIGRSLEKIPGFREFAGSLYICCSRPLID